MTSRDCPCKCEICAKQKADLARWRLFLGSNPELLPWRAGVYLVGKHFWENAPTAGLIAALFAVAGGTLYGFAWLVGVRTAFAFLAGAVASVMVWGAGELIARRNR